MLIVWEGGEIQEERRGEKKYKKYKKR